MKKTAVIGIGNQLMGDEGAGIEALRVLEEMGCPEGVELIDAGTAFFAIVPDLKDFEKLIILDVARGGCPPGTVYRFGMGDVQDGHALISLHDMGVIESLKLESLAGKIPEEIVFIGIEPQKVGLSIGLSPPVAERMNYFGQKVLEELRKSQSVAL